MANEKRLIYLDDIFPNHCFYVNEKDPMKSLDELINRINNAPTVDALEVVRCRDCKYFSRDEEYNRAWCNYYSGCLEVAVNGYCYHGAKMDGGNEDA